MVKESLCMCVCVCCYSDRVSVLLTGHQSFSFRFASSSKREGHLLKIFGRRQSLASYRVGMFAMQDEASSLFERGSTS